MHICGAIIMIIDIKTAFFSLCKMYLILRDEYLLKIIELLQILKIFLQQANVKI